MDDARWKLPLLNSYIEKWALETPDNEAVIQDEDGKSLTYQQFASIVDLFTLRLHAMGIQKGDRVSTMFLTFTEHLALIYACFKAGAIIAPLDIRLKENEVVRDLDKIKPVAFFFHGLTPVRDFREVGRVVRDRCPYIEHLVQLQPDAGPEEIIPGAVSFTELFALDKLLELKNNPDLTVLMEERYKGLDKRDPALIIYTTGTTGAPKPAVLCHENIIIQNEILARGIGLWGKDWRMLCPLPMSHVAGTSEIPMTTLYAGGTVVMMRAFTPASVLEAVQKWKITILGMIPTQFRMLWALPGYREADLSSLKSAVYAGSAVDIQFLYELYKTAPAIGTGLGMTENAGFATFTPPGISPEEMAGQVGRSFPELAEVTVRKPMHGDGTAGDEQPDGELGEICYHPPIVFLGYYNQPEETARTVSREGILYTGDMGCYKDMGTYRAFYMSGRRKFMIKQKGYNVFPDEVSAFIAEHPKVAMADVVGVPHRLFDEGIFAFVQPKPGMEVTEEEILQHCQGIASYKRPQHVEFWSPDRPWPLTRVAKVDKIELQNIALAITEKLRENGKWDA